MDSSMRLRKDTQLSTISQGHKKGLAPSIIAVDTRVPSWRWTPSKREDKVLVRCNLDSLLAMVVSAI